MDESSTDAGRIAIVTGASGGIGKAIAERFVEKDITPVLAARREGQIETLADDLSLGSDVAPIAVRTDVRDRDSVVALVEETIDTFGRIDIVVNNAGITGTTDGRFEESPIDAHRDVIETNVTGTLSVTYETVKHLRESQGNLVFIGSSAGTLPRPASPVYAATKWWVRGFAKSIEAHAGIDGVAVTVVNPTAVRTRLWSETLDPGQAAEPSDVADIVAVAVDQPAHSTLSEVNLFRRDMLGTFLPESVDLDMSFEVDGDDRP